MTLHQDHSGVSCFRAALAHRLAGVCLDYEDLQATNISLTSENGRLKKLLAAMGSAESFRGALPANSATERFSSETCDSAPREERRQAHIEDSDQHEPFLDVEMTTQPNERPDPSGAGRSTVEGEERLKTCEEDLAARLLKQGQSRSYHQDFAFASPAIESSHITLREQLEDQSGNSCNNLVTRAWEQCSQAPTEHTHSHRTLEPNCSSVALGPSISQVALGPSFSSQDLQELHAIPRVDCSRVLRDVLNIDGRSLTEAAASGLGLGHLRKEHTAIVFADQVVNGSSPQQHVPSQASQQLQQLQLLQHHGEMDPLTALAQAERGVCLDELQRSGLVDVMFGAQDLKLGLKIRWVHPPVITGVMPGTPAALLDRGPGAGDRLVHVNGVDVTAMAHENIQRLLRTRPLRLVFLRAGSEAALAMGSPGSQSSSTIMPASELSTLVAGGAPDGLSMISNGTAIAAKLRWAHVVVVD